MENDKLNNRNEEVFEALLKIATKEAARLDIEDMPDCEELDKEFSPSFSFESRIKKIITRQERNASMKRNFTSFGKIAVAFSVFVVMSLLALFTVEASRNFIFNMIINMHSDHAVIGFGEIDGYSPDAIYELAYLPLDFRLRESPISR